MPGILEIENLHVDIHTDSGVVRAVRGVSLSLERGETLAVVGESGSGKSITFKSVMGLLPSGGKVSSGKILLDGRDITRLSEKEFRGVRGKDISMIFQDPLTSLNPTMPVGRQIAETLVIHRRDMDAKRRNERVMELLDMVGIPSPKERAKEYPHQFSGGMRQRVMIAIALACSPKALIADEPTTALDVTIQAQILDLMRSLQKKINTAIVIITHNLGVVANIADRVEIMYGGRFVEEGTLDEAFYEMAHPYSKGLMESIPKLHEREQTLYSIPGSPPDLMAPPAGCPFAARCQSCMKVCETHPPEETRFSATHKAYCWLYDERAKATVTAVKTAAKGNGTAVKAAAKGADAI